jgi:hypothetical protein
VLPRLREWPVRELGRWGRPVLFVAFFFDHVAVTLSRDPET